MDRDQRIYFRDRFRQARNVVLNDAENFVAVSHEVERLGRYLSAGKGRGLNDYETAIIELAQRSPLAKDVPGRWPQCHIEADVLYRLHQRARNDAIHEGAAARCGAAYAVSLALILEDALMDDDRVVGHVMVRDPVCASMWQPISFVRQTLLANSYSFLPVQHGEGAVVRWGLVSDFAVASYLRLAASNAERRRRLATPLVDAIRDEDGVHLDDAYMCQPDESIERALAASGGRPVLVVGDDLTILLGIATPFDML
jgi:hypothetical protein